MFERKIVCNAVREAFSNTLTMAFPFEMGPELQTADEDGFILGSSAA